MYHHIRLDLASLRIYRRILNDLVIKKLIIALENAQRHGLEGMETVDSFNDFIFELYNTKRTFKEHIVFLILHDDNPFSKLAEQEELLNMDKLFVQDVKKDLQILASLYWLDSKQMFRDDFNGYQNGGSDDIGFVTELDWSRLVDNLASYYKANSRGLVSIYPAFYWDRNKGLQGIANLPELSLDDLIGCDAQIAQIRQNTEQFLDSKPANNVLLYGPRGTGKSTAVKALLNEYSQDGLRLIEIAREDLECIPQVISFISEYNRKFILFLDDLSFEDYETGYKGLKAVLEGSLEATPSNLLIYATSNRRHLVKEYFTDRARPSSDEVHAQDTLQEKLSLADRFGLTITFPAIDKKTYLDIVQNLAQQRNLDMKNEVLERLALEWERSHHGRSGRTARQFVDSLGIGDVKG